MKSYGSRPVGEGGAIRAKGRHNPPAFASILAEAAHVAPHSYHMIASPTHLLGLHTGQQQPMRVTGPCRPVGNPGPKFVIFALVP